jgi:FkbM family methyltransferase
VPRSLSGYIDRIQNTARGLGHELRGGFNLTGDLPSFLRFASDVFLSRLIGRVPLPNTNRDRAIRLRDGIELHYRLNRGDMQSIREVWIDEVYRLPFDLQPKLLVDLGANIGLTSLWLARRYGCRTIIAVEPSPENARLARLNLTGNDIAAEVVEAAVGPRDGTAFFAEEQDSNLGHLAAAGREVQVFSMEAILSRLPPGSTVDLVKMDIEGGEGPLMRENLGWLGRVHSIIAELHPTVIDSPALIRALESQGFRYIPAAHSADGSDSMDAFIRSDIRSDMRSDTRSDTQSDRRPG